MRQTLLGRPNFVPGIGLIGQLNTDWPISIGKRELKP